MNTNNIVQFLQSKVFLAMTVAVFGIAVLVATFSAGVAVGYHKAKFSYAWGENYTRNFAGPRGGFLHDMDGRDFIDSHGTFGEIIKIDGPVVLMQGREGMERAIILGSDTVIKLFQESVASETLHIGDRVVVIGSPDGEGRIQAKFIRVMPAPQAMPPLHIR